MKSAKVVGSDDIGPIFEDDDVMPASPPEFFSTEFVFPRSAKVGEVEMSTGGLTLRDYFAAQAMVGIVTRGLESHCPPLSADVAYVIADAMLEARKR